MIEQVGLTEQAWEEWVYREYDLFPQKIEEWGNVKKISCDQGVFALKKTLLSMEQMEWTEQALRYAANQGFAHLLPFVQNKFGDHFVRTAEHIYYVTFWIEDKTDEKYRADWEMRLMECLALLHQYTVSMPEIKGGAKPLAFDRLEERWSRRLQQMEGYKHLAEERSLLSPFELSFLNHYNYLRKLAEQALVYLKEWRSKGFDQAENRRFVLTHGFVQRQHVVHDGAQLYLINFDQAKVDSPVRDIALFFRRHLDLNLERDEEIALEWLAAYEQIFPIKHEEKLLLAIYLLFPERIYKEVELYYQQVRQWDPLKYTRYFERLIKTTYLIRKLIKRMLE